MMNSLETKTESLRYYDTFDGLRLVLALIVMLSHSIIWLTVDGDSAIYEGGTWGTVHSFQQGVIRLLLAVTNATCAVNVFFVISGAVLGSYLCAAYEEKQLYFPPFHAQIASLYRSYGTQRIFRIMPTHLLVISITALILLAGGHPSHNPLASDYYRYWYPPHLRHGLIMPC